MRPKYQNKPESFEKSISLKYRADIDGLRAIAVLSVVSYHAFPQTISGGYVGVDIFFIISGFLISGILFNELDNGSFSFKDFYYRRIRRIFPALSLVLGTCIVSGWILLLPEEYKQLSKHIAGGSGFISNFLLWQEAGYFDHAAETKPLLHLWSLGIEEQFYLLWPLIIFLAWRRLTMHKLILTILLISFTLNELKVNSDAIGTFYSPVTRFWELLAGALLALYHSRGYRPLQSRVSQPCGEAPIAPTANELLALGGLALLLCSIFGLSANIAYPGWWALMPTTGAVLLILAGSSTWVNRNVLGNRISIMIGLISYPLYLWHWPLLTYSRILSDGATSTEITLAAILSSAVLATLTYRFVELPLRFGTNRERKAIGLCLAMLLIGTAGFYVYKHNGFDRRPSFEEYRHNRLALIEDVSAHNKENCTASPQFPYQGLNHDFFCMKSQEGNHLASNIIIGDSHAYPMYFGFYDLFVKQRGEELQMMGAPGCPPLLGLESFEAGSRDACKVFMNALLTRVLDDPNVKRVILVNRGQLYTSGTGFGDTDKHHRIIHRSETSKPESNSLAYKNALTSTLNLLSHHGKKIILVMPPPELGFEPINCVKTHPFMISQKTLADCKVSYEKYHERSTEFRGIVSSVTDKIESIVLIDPETKLCDSISCIAYKNGRFLYSDNNHLSAFGAKYVVTGSDL